MSNKRSRNRRRVQRRLRALCLSRGWVYIARNHGSRMLVDTCWGTTVWVTP